MADGRVEVASGAGVVLGFLVRFKLNRGRFPNKRDRLEEVEGGDEVEGLNRILVLLSVVLNYITKVFFMKFS